MASIGNDFDAFLKGESPSLPSLKQWFLALVSKSFFTNTLVRHQSNKWYQMAVLSSYTLGVSFKSHGTGIGGLHGGKISLWEVLRQIEFFGQVL